MSKVWREIFYDSGSIFLTLSSSEKIENRLRFDKIKGTKERDCHFLWLSLYVAEWIINQAYA